MPQRVKESGLYLIENTVSGSFYVGSTGDLVMRRRTHWWAMTNGKCSNRRMGFAVTRYGIDAFRWHVLTPVPMDGLLEAEEALLRHVVGRRDCYNVCVEPQSGMRGRTHTAEARAKIGAGHKGRSFPGVAAAQRGRKHSPETIEQRASKLRGQQRTDEQRQAISDGMRRWHASKKPPAAA